MNSESIGIFDLLLFFYIYVVENILLQPLFKNFVKSQYFLAPHRKKPTNSKVLLICKPNLNSVKLVQSQIV